MNLLYHWPWPTMSNFIRRKYNFVNHPISKKSRPNCFRRKICVPKTSVYLILVCDMVATRLRRWNLVSDGNKIPIRNYFFSLSLEFFGRATVNVGLRDAENTERKLPTKKRRSKSGSSVGHLFNIPRLCYIVTFMQEKNQHIWKCGTTPGSFV